jgi:pyruvate ferredoxin oxidoreductase delta subunit
MTSKQKGWKEIPIAGVCWKPTTEYLTGDWRTFKPVLDSEKCNKCLLCYVYCPDGAIEWKTEAEEIEFNYKYCKGCGICANECRREAIKMVLE